MEPFSEDSGHDADAGNVPTWKSAMACGWGNSQSLERLTWPGYYTDVELAWSHGIDDVSRPIGNPSPMFYNIDADHPPELYTWLARHADASSTSGEEPVHYHSRRLDEDMIAMNAQPYTRTGCLCLISRCQPSDKGTMHPFLPPGQPPPPPRPPGYVRGTVAADPYWLQCPCNLLRQPMTIPVPEASEVNINSRDLEGHTVKFHSVDEDKCSGEASCDSDRPSVTPDSQNLMKESSPSRRKSHGSLKEKLASILRKFSLKRSSETDSAAHILVQEPGAELQLSSGQIDQAELAAISRFTGTWKVDRKVSDSCSTLCKVMELGWVFRRALTASSMIKIKCTPNELIYTIQVIGLGSFEERRPWSGEKVEHRRRDLRRGKIFCSVQRYSQGLVMRSDWSGPLGGKCFEYLELAEDSMSLVLRMDLYRNASNGAGKEVHMRLVLRRSA